MATCRIPHRMNTSTGIDLRISRVPFGPPQSKQGPREQEQFSWTTLLRRTFWSSKENEIVRDFTSKKKQDVSSKKLTISHFTVVTAPRPCRVDPEPWCWAILRIAQQQRFTRTVCMYRSNNMCINQRIAFRKHHNSVTVSAEVSSLEWLTGVHAVDGWRSLMQ